LGGSLGKIWGSVPPGPNVEPPLIISKVVLLRRKPKHKVLDRTTFS